MNEITIGDIESYHRELVEHQERIKNLKLVLTPTDEQWQELFTIIRRLSWLEDQINAFNSR